MVAATAGTNLTTVTIPTSVTSIGDKAFADCSRLAGVHFQGNAPSLGSAVFTGANNATVYYLPGTAGWGKTFGGRPTVLLPFSYTSSNGTITITGNSKVEGVVIIPDMIDDLPVTTIGERAFSFRPDVTSVTIGTNVTNIGVDAFWQCTRLTNVTIPNGVISIDAGAFIESGLTSVMIPASVTNIGNGAFDCYSLTTITVNASNAFYSSDDGILFDKSQTKLVEFPGRRKMGEPLVIVHFFGGDGVPINATEAVKWLRKGVDKGDADAQDELGDCYYLGSGVPQDYAEAVKWYRKAADQGFASAQCDLGICYREGKGVPRDYVEAVKWYRKASDQGDADAQCDLGYCYERGYGVPQDDAEAVKWYRKAANQGQVDAQYNLGDCYATGQGVIKNLQTAYGWFLLASDAGDNNAATEIKNIESELSPAEVLAARNWAKHWQPVIDKSSWTNQQPASPLAVVSIVPTSNIAWDPSTNGLSLGIAQTPDGNALELYFRNDTTNTLHILTDELWWHCNLFVDGKRVSRSDDRKDLCFPKETAKDFAPVEPGAILKQLVQLSMWEPVPRDELRLQYYSETGGKEFGLNAWVGMVSSGIIKTRVPKAVEPTRAPEGTHGSP